MHVWVEIGMRRIAAPPPINQDLYDMYALLVARIVINRPSEAGLFAGHEKFVVELVRGPRARDLQGAISASGLALPALERLHLLEMRQDILPSRPCWAQPS